MSRSRAHNNSQLREGFYTRSGLGGNSDGQAAAFDDL
jgi:hypothetical protein